MYSTFDSIHFQLNKINYSYVKLFHLLSLSLFLCIIHLYFY